MSRVHDNLKHKGPERRPVRRRNASVPSVLVSDSPATDLQADKSPPAETSSIVQLKSRLIAGITAIQQENRRLKQENQQLRARLGENM